MQVMSCPGLDSCCRLHGAGCAFPACAGSCSEGLPGRLLPGIYQRAEAAGSCQGRAVRAVSARQYMQPALSGINGCTALALQHRHPHTPAALDARNLRVLLMCAAPGSFGLLQAAECQGAWLRHMSAVVCCSLQRQYQFLAHHWLTHLNKPRFTSTTYQLLHADFLHLTCIA